MTIEVTIINGPLDPRTMPEAPATNGGGAVVRFDGVVRGLENERPITGLDYEVYQPMAERMLRQLAQDVAARHGLLHVAVWHSRGRVPVGQASFRLLVVAPHRREALAATADFIDAMKHDVPIWKSAVSSSGPAAAEASIIHRSPTSVGQAAQSPAT